jgi:hypothetical protein
MSNPTPQGRGRLTDRQITLIGLIVAIIGAAAAVAVVPEFRCWVLHVDCPSSETPAGAASIPAVTECDHFAASTLDIAGT